MSDAASLFVYAGLADAAYVLIPSLPDGSPTALPEFVASEAIAQRRLPTALADELLGDETTRWDVVNHNHWDNPTSGFAATLFRRASATGDSDEYVLAIRGTETEGDQLWIDLLGADVGEIGFIGMALSQTVSLVNYVFRLTSPAGSVAPQLTLRTSSERAEPDGKRAFGVAGDWYWLEAAPTAEGLDAIPLGTKIKVAGHSLGGHLAAIAARLFPDLISDAYAFNAPGCDSSTADVVVAALTLTVPPYPNFARALAVGGAKQLTEQIIEGIGDYLAAAPTLSFEELAPRMHIYKSEDIAPGDDRDVISSRLTGREFGTAAGITVEKNSHGMGQIVDSLSLQLLFEHLGFSGQVQMEALYNAAAPDAASAQEVLLTALHELFVNPDTKPLPTVEAGTRDSSLSLPWISSGNFAARSSWYDMWDPVEKAILSAGPGLELVPIGEKSTGQIAQDAMSDVAYRFALQTRIPFAVTGFDYAAGHGGSRDLEMFDPATGSGALTSEWIRDRSEMLYWHLVRNRDDVLDVVPNAAGLAYQFIERRVVDDAVVEDRIRVGVSISQTRRVAFGSERADQWNGLGEADSLYGGGGDDRLAGLAGEDYLQGDAGSDFLHGGAGNDTLVGGKDTDVLIGGAGADLYRWRRGDGSDYVIDFVGDGFGGDGVGAIEFLGTTLTGSLALADQSSSERTYTGPQGLTYTLTGAYSGRGILTISTPDEPGEVSILGFRSGDLGLTLDVPVPIEKSQQAGTSASDTLQSSADREQVFGYEGNDRITLLHVHAEAHGGEGHEYLTSNAGNVKLLGEEGRDILIADNGADELYGGDDADALQGGAGADYLTAGAGDDVADGGAGADVIEGSDGDDFLLGGGSLVPGVEWSPSAEPSQFGALVVPGQITGVQGMVGDINVEGDAEDLIDAGAGTDTVLAGDGRDVVLGGPGADYLVGQAGDDALNGEDGDDFLLGDGSEGSLELGGHSYFTQPHAHGKDILAGGLGNDHLEGDGGADQLYGNEGDDSLDGDSGWLEGAYHGNDYLDGGDGNDWITGSGGIDTLYGGAGDDWMQGDSSMVPSALKGDDSLFGGEGADRMIGDGGADQLFGEADDDFLFGDADDNDAAYDGADLLDGGDGNDYLRGYGGDDTLFGGAGDDILLGDGDGIRAGETGNDTLVGGPGYDRMDGGRGDDRYEFTAGDGIDKIFDSSGVNTVVFRAGISASGITVLQGQDESSTYAVVSYGANDLLAVENGFTGGVQFYSFADGTVLTPAELTRRLDRGQYGSVQGGSGDDTLMSTSLLEVLDGGSGDDVYLFGADSGNDICVDAGGSDTLRFDSTVAQEEVAFTRTSRGDLIVKVTGGAEIRIEAHYLAPERRIEAVSFANGATFDATIFDDLPIAPIAGSTGDDWLIGTDFPDTLYGGPGRDSLVGGRGPDIYVFRRGDGEDTITDGGRAGESNEGDRIQLRGFSRNDVSLERTIEGTLTLRSRDGRDSITLPNLFNDANRIETIELYADPAGNEPDETLSFSELEALPTVPVFGTEGDDTFTGSDTADTFLGEGGNDLIMASSGDDLLHGGAGDDVLAGGPGADTYLFDRGAGHDLIQEADDGSNAADTVWFGTDVSPNEVAVSRNGNDLVFAIGGLNDSLTVAAYFATPAAVVEEFRFDDGTAWSDAMIAQKVSKSTAGDDVLMGTAASDVLNGLAGNDTLYGRGGNDRLYGEVGNDSLNGEDGADLLNGGPGSDYLYGGTGSDTYSFGRGFGFDWIYDYQPEDGTDAVDAIQFTADVQPADVIARYSAPNLELAIGGTGDKLVVAGYFSTQSPGLQVVEEVRFGDGTIWDFATIKSRVLLPTEAPDTLIGFDSDEVISGAGGDDLVRGDGGNDTIDGGAGDDNLYGGSGDDWLVGGAGNDRLRGEDGSDSYFYDAGDGDDTLYNSDASSATDALVFGGGISPAQVRFTRANTNYQDLWITFSGHSGLITIPDYFTTGSAGALDEIRFTNDPGTVWTVAGLRSTFVATDDKPNNPIGYDTADTIDGLDGDDRIRGLANNDTLLGGPGNDELLGDTGDDWLDGGAGHDTLRGGSGNDTYVFGRGAGHDVIDESSAGAGYDTLRLGAGILPEDVTLHGHSADMVLTITGDPAQVWVTSYFTLADRPIEQIAFADGTLWDGAAIAARAFPGTPNAMSGTAGDDEYIVDHSGDTIAEAAEQGTDTVRSAISCALPANVEHLVLTGLLDTHATGNALANTLTGNRGNNVLRGDPGADWSEDTLIGGPGDDTYLLGSFYDYRSYDQIVEQPGEGVDTVLASLASYELPANVEKLVMQSNTYVAREAFGNALDNTIVIERTGLSSSQSFLIDGAGGADRMIGSDSGDTYVVDDPGDVVVEEAAVNGHQESVDEVRSRIDYALGANVENLRLEPGSLAVCATGNGLANQLYGNEGDNRLDGLGGADYLAGGMGNDTYVADALDTVLEHAGAGMDTVWSVSTYALPANVENVVLTGTGAVDAKGNSLANTLTGNAASNVLDGGAGADVMQGGAGDDTYFVDEAGDIVVERAEEGVDTIVSAVTYRLPSAVDNLVLTGDAAIDGNGNELGNVLRGNGASNTLWGAAGDDTYYVGAGDIVTERLGQGVDTIVAGQSWSLGKHIENLTLTGSGDFSATGNNLANVLIGNDGDNWLDGKGGADEMAGGRGNDTYVVAQGADLVIERADEGIDTVLASVGHTLGEHIENLTLTGGAINGTGNDLANVLTGNAADNRLTGGAGADTLEGLGGTDTLVGGLGDDTYLLGRGYGIDAIVENDSTFGNTDRAVFLDGIESEQIWFRRVDDDLEASVIGSSDAFVLRNWYRNAARRVERFEIAEDGKTLLQSQVQALVDAMAPLAPPVPGVTALPPDYQAVLSPVIAASWQ